MVSAYYWGFPLGVVSVIEAVAVLLSPAGGLEAVSALVLHGCQWIGGRGLAISFELSLLPLFALMGIMFGDGQIGNLGSSEDRSGTGGNDLFGGACATVPFCRMGGVEGRS